MPYLPILRAQHNVRVLFSKQLLYVFLIKPGQAHEVREVVPANALNEAQGHGVHEEVLEDALFVLHNGNIQHL
jgi:hypothetical protein